MIPLTEEQNLFDTPNIQSIISKFSLDKADQDKFLSALEVQKTIEACSNNNCEIDLDEIDIQTFDSSPQMQFSQTQSINKRGRKRKSQSYFSNNNNDNNDQINLDSEIDDETNRNKIIRFGNRYVEKDTPEYNQCRSRNNEAVERCRQKKAEIKRKEEEKFKLMSNEIENLKTQIHKLSTEVEYWKQMATNFKFI